MTLELLATHLAPEIEIVHPLRGRHVSDVRCLKEPPPK